LKYNKHADDARVRYLAHRSETSLEALSKGFDGQPLELDYSPPPVLDISPIYRLVVSSSHGKIKVELLKR